MAVLSKMSPPPAPRKVKKGVFTEGTPTMPPPEWVFRSGAAPPTPPATPVSHQVTGPPGAPQRQNHAGLLTEDEMDEAPPAFQLSCLATSSPPASVSGGERSASAPPAVTAGATPGDVEVRLTTTTTTTAAAAAAQADGQQASQRHHHHYHHHHTIPSHYGGYQNASAGGELASMRRAFAEAQNIFPGRACVLVGDLPVTPVYGVAGLCREIQYVFGCFGECYVKVIRDQRRPFAFVQFRSVQAADAAVHLGQGLAIAGRPCRVQLSHSQRTVMVARRDGAPITLAEGRYLLGQYGQLEGCRLLAAPHPARAMIGATFVTRGAFERATRASAATHPAYILYH